MKTFALLVFVTYCSPLFAGEIAEMHKQLPHTNQAVKPRISVTETGMTISLSSREAITNHGITEIGIERTRCYGICPAYTFIVKSDGTFSYEGTNDVERNGTFKGTLSVWYFNRLAQFIRDSDYMELENSYRRVVTDKPTVYTTVVMKGKRKVISNYASSGPSKLWAIEELIDDLMSKVKWTEPPNAADKPK